MNPELKTYKTASATFLIPCNAVGEEMPEPIDEDYENIERAAAFINWYEQNIERELMKNDFYE